MLHPDASTLEVLPWRPQTGRVARFYCDITTGEGEPFEQDGRQILRRALQALLEEGYTARVGAKCEFYLFRLDENGDPTPIPHDRAGFLDVAPLDRGENVRRDICLTLEEMGIRPLSSHHEMGPGQNEISIAPADPMTAANHCVTFRNLVGAIAARNGLYADMGPKPLPEEKRQRLPHQLLPEPRRAEPVSAPRRTGRSRPRRRASSRACFPTCRR